MRTIKCLFFLSFLLGFTELDYRLMNHKQFHTSLQSSQKKSAAKKDTDNLSTQSDNSTLSTMQMQTRSGKSAEVNYTGQNDENNDDDDDEVNYFCKMCEYSESNIDAFVGHYSRAHKKNIFVCRVAPCIKWHNTSAGLRQHCKHHHSDVLSCDSCGLVSLSPIQKQAHMDTHINAKFTCSTCNRNCTRADDGRRHFKYVCAQNPNRVIKCKHCIKSKAADPDVPGAEPGLMSHLQRVHNMKGCYLCINCHSFFEKGKAIEAHKHTCTKTNPGTGAN